MNKKGFTLIEMLTTTAILVIVFGLLAIIFGRATTIHKIVRSGGDAENFGIYLINTIVYGPGINREKGLTGTQPFAYGTILSPTVLQFKDTNNNDVTYTLNANTLSYGPSPGIDLKPTWAKDRKLEVLLTDSKFSYYKDIAGVLEASTSTDTVYAVGITLTLKNTLQNIQEAVTLYRCVRVRNQIDF